MKKKILLVPDEDYWIFYRHCQEMKTRLTEYDITIKTRHEIKTSSFDYLNTFDLIYLLDAPLSIPHNNSLKHKMVLGVRAEFYYPHDTEGLTKYYNKYIKPRASAFHVVNMKQYNEFKNICDIPVFYAPHGINTDIFNETTNIINEPLIVGTNGSKGSLGKKGFDIVQEACNILNLECKTTFQIAGGGHLTTEEMPQYYKNIDIYCNMSVSEGCNNSIMEAGAMGKMVIATPVGAAPQIIEDYKTGLICSRSVESLVEKLSYCINNIDSIKTCGFNLHERIVNEWSWDKRIGNYKNLFNEVL